MIVTFRAIRFWPWRCIRGRNWLSWSRSSASPWGADLMPSDQAASLVAAAIVTVILFPALAGHMLRKSSP